MERAHLLAQLDLLKTQRIQAERQIAQLAAQDDRVPRLMQITGIGYFAAFAILAAIGNIQRFPSAKRLASYAGLVPSLHQSGDQSYSGHITRAGSPNLRWLLVEAAWSAVRFDPHWQQVYEGIQRRRGRSIAIVAIARKILVVVWHLLSNHSTYYYLQPQIFVRKLQEWAWRIGRKELPSTSSIAFVQDRLNSVGLSDLAKALTTNRKGKLQFERQISTQLEKDAKLPSCQSALLAV